MDKPLSRFKHELLHGHEPEALAPPPREKHDRGAGAPGPAPGSPKWQEQNPGVTPQPLPLGYRMKLRAKEAVDGVLNPLKRAQQEIEEADLGQSALTKIFGRQGK